MKKNARYIFPVIVLAFFVFSLKAQTDLPAIKQQGITQICGDNSTKLATTAYVQACGGSGGGGTVTSVAATGANGIGVSGSPVTSSGTLGFSLGAITPTSVSTGWMSANTFLGSPSASTSLLEQNAGNLILDAVGSSGNYGTFTFRCVNATGPAVRNCLLSDALGNWTALGSVTAANLTSANTISASGAVTAASFSTPNGGTITIGGVEVCLQSGSNCPSSGTGTVTSVSVTTANGVSGTVANPTTTPAISLTLGAITPSSVASSGAITQGGTAVCLQNGTNCPSSSGYTLGGSVTNSNFQFSLSQGIAGTIVSSLGYDKSHSVIFTAGGGLSAGLAYYRFTYTTARSVAGACIATIHTFLATGAPDTGLHTANILSNQSTTTQYTVISGIGDANLISGYEYEIVVSCP